MRSTLVALLLIASACTRTEAPLPPPPDPQAAQRIAAIEQSMQAAGVPATRTEQLRSLQEFPNCDPAQMRYRIHFGESPRFVNVSRFATPEQAQRCLEDFKATALKAGPSGWERLSPTISTNGPWLYLFPQDFADGVTRRKVVQALQQVD